MIMIMSMVVIVMGMMILTDCSGHDEHDDGNDYSQVYEYEYDYDHDRDSDSDTFL